MMTYITISAKNHERVDFVGECICIENKNNLKVQCVNFHGIYGEVDGKHVVI